MSNIKISQLTQFSSSPTNVWLVMNNSAQTETFKITRETLLSGLIECSDVLASQSLQANNFFPKDDLDLNISTRTDSGTKNINLMTGPKPGGLGYTRVKITSGGTVGININNPTALLDVSVPTGSTVGFRVSGNSNTDLVRITQTGSGNALVVEDSDNPDSTPFVIKNDGKIYLGSYTEETTSLLNVGGSAVFWNNIFINGTTNRVIRNSVDGRASISFAATGDSYLNNGNFGLGTTAPTQKLHVSGNTLIEGDIIYPSPTTPPTNSGDTGTKGTVTWDGSYFYICVDTNTWKRSQLLSW